MTTPPLWLIPAIPLAGFLVNGLLGTRLGKSFVSAVGVGAAGLATVVAYARLIPFFAGSHAPVVEPVARWIAVYVGPVPFSSRCATTNSVASATFDTAAGAAFVFRVIFLTLTFDMTAVLSAIEA